MGSQSTVTFEGVQYNRKKNVVDFIVFYTFFFTTLALDGRILRYHLFYGHKGRMKNCVYHARLRRAAAVWTHYYYLLSRTHMAFP